MNTTPWHLIPDAIVLSWAALELAQEIYVPLVNHAIRLSTKGATLTRGSWDYTTDEQKRRLEALLPRVEHVLQAAYKLQYWVDEREGCESLAKPCVDRPDEVTTWTASELLLQTHAVLIRHLPPLVAQSDELLSGMCGFSCDDQRARLGSFRRDLRPIERVAYCLQIWCDRHV